MGETDVGVLASKECFRPRSSDSDEGFDCNANYGDIVTLEVALDAAAVAAVVAAAVAAKDPFFEGRIPQDFGRDLVRLDMSCMVVHLSGTVHFPRVDVDKVLLGAVQDHFRRVASDSVVVVVVATCKAWEVADYHIHCSWRGLANP